MNIIMDGAATQAQIGSYLTALRMKGETWEEIAGSAAAMLTCRASHTDIGGRRTIDRCGRHGRRRHTFNISTMTAFVMAGAGYKVAKHGNRGEQ